MKYLVRRNVKTFIKSKHDTFSFMVWYFPESPDGANADHPMWGFTDSWNIHTSQVHVSVQTKDGKFWKFLVLDPGDVFSTKYGAIILQKLYH